MIKLQRSGLGTLGRHMNRLLRLEYIGCTSPLLCCFAGWVNQIHGMTIPAEGPYRMQTLHELIGFTGQIVS
ncbi:hypothetical protein RDI58_007493 [Solanum bulbocastanum]|uniref:Uncharacterized protein n=1 Tax=Solanum bulbocastanum TaxID=147425 RepID=A0AAN8TV40_SOLBU